MKLSVFLSKRKIEVPKKKESKVFTTMKIDGSLMIYNTNVEGYNQALSEILDLDIGEPLVPLDEKEIQKLFASYFYPDTTIHTALINTICSYGRPAEKRVSVELQELLKDWLEFSSDVRPSDYAGEEWLEILTKKTKEAIYGDCKESK